MKYAFLFGGFLLLLAVSCTSEPQAEEQKAWEEVMAIHDEVMPETATINRHKRRLEAHLADTSLTLPPQLREKAKNTIQELEAAEEGMMVWMDQIKSPEALQKSMEHEAILAYLEEERKKIEQVRDDMINSIRSGNEVIGIIEQN